MNLRAYSAWLLKRKFISVPPLGCKIKHSRMKECSDTMFLQISFVGIYLHVHEKSENKVEKDKKNLSILNEILANNISQSTTPIS